MTSKLLNLSIFYKLIGAFLLVIIPLFAIGMMMNQSGADIIRDGNYELMVQKSDFVMASIETEFKRISQLQREFANDTDLQDLSIRSASLDEYEWTKAVNNLYSKLTVLAGSSKYIREAFVMMPNIQRRLSSITRLENMNAEELRHLNKPVTQSTNFIYWNDRLYMSVGYPITSRTQYLLVLEISLDNVSKDLGFFENNSGNTTYLLDERNDSIISYKRTEPGRQDVLKQLRNIGKQPVSIDGNSFLVFNKHSDFLDWTLIALLREGEVLAPVNAFKKWYLFLSVMALLIVLSVSFVIYRLIHRPLQKLIHAFRYVEQGELDYVVRRRGKDEFHYLYEQFNQMVGKLKKLIREVYEQKIHSQKSELKQLQSQINPHFLYNSLYILYRMAQNEDHEGVSELSKHMGDYFKFITQSNSDFVPLEREIHHAQTYAAIQQTRFTNRISCSFRIAGSCEGREVPRLIIQPFLENAFLHGLATVKKNGRIDVDITVEGAIITIEVTDNGAGMSGEQLEEWRYNMKQTDYGSDNGVWNVHRRLQLHYGAASGIELKRNDYGGLTAIITIRPEGEDRSE